jgi:glutamyl-tRNA reductase
MRILLLGINHRTAPVAVREGLAIGPDRLPGVLAAFREAFPRPAEAALISTCNRTEMYLARPSHGRPSIDEVRDFLAQQTGVAADDLSAVSIHREQRPAVHHLFRVTAGLDAMAVGESQVLGQVRRAYEAARDAETAGPILHRLFQRALSGARDAHRSSGIDGLRQSVSSMAVEFAGNLFESFHDKTVAGIGAGEITKSTLQRMLEKRPGRTWVVNRTAEAGRNLAQALGLSLDPSPETSGGGAKTSGGGARAWEELDEVLVEADVVLTGTGAAEPVITAARFRPLLRRRRNRPLFLIDLAVPRDVEPAVGTLPNVYLYNLDDLNAALAEIPHRREKIERCELLVSEAADRCLGETQHQDVGVLVKQLRTKLLTIGDDERARTQRKVEALHARGEYDRIHELLDEHTHRLINKVLHLPLSQLDARDKQVPMGFYAAALRRLFDLEDGAAANGDARAAGLSDLTENGQADG